MKSRFFDQSAVITNVKDYFKSCITFDSDILQYSESGDFYKPKSYNVFSINDSFTIFSFEYDMKFLYIPNHKNYLYPKIDTTNTVTFSLSVKRSGAFHNPEKINPERKDIEVILYPDTNTFIINIKVENSSIN